jgi:hypothetical protein
VQHHLQPLRHQLLAQRGGRRFVGELQLDAAEARARSAFEALQQRHFGEQHRQVGGKTGHGAVSGKVFIGPGGLGVAVQRT